MKAQGLEFGPINQAGRLRTNSHAGVLTSAVFGVPVKFPCNAEIYGQGEPADYVYEVVRGAVRTCLMMADGRRQIGAFHFTGDIFGLEAGDNHALSAEAIIGSQIGIIKRTSLIGLACRDKELVQKLRILTERELARAQEHAMLLIKTASERLEAFLLELAGRQNGRVIRLPMSRQDIADYLGVTIETVSRSFSLLEKDAVIALPQQRLVVMLNRSKLKP